MKNILLPIDFSDVSLNAMEYAVQLFRDENCVFFVLNTYEPVALYSATAYGMDPALNMDIGELFKEASEKKVQKAIDKVALKFQDSKHVFRGISSFNMLSLEVKEQVEYLDIDIVIMGTKGASGLKEVFIGSQTLHVIKNAKVPVIGVPAEYAYQLPKDILFTTDFKTDTNQKGLDLLEQLCSKYSSRLIFLNVLKGASFTDQQIKNQQALKAFFKSDTSVTHIVKGVEVLDAMEEFQLEHNIELLVLVHNRHNFFENLLFTPTVQKIVHHSNVPFLILPQQLTQ
ncbi:universal stress protein [Nonlabens sp.]|uniref:universal stress protein n=1 Tax=Nonlabens sp. TaxID=1888209 RepID=UPI001BCAE13F|nr:universal stress protein [Nonlabens sp.]